MRECGASNDYATARAAVRRLSADVLNRLKVAVHRKSTKALAEYAIRLHENTTVSSRVLDKQFAATAVKLDRCAVSTNRLPGRIVVELDDVASALARQNMRNGTPGLICGPAEDLRDLVSAAVVFMLETDDQCVSVDEWLEQARARRVALEAKEAA